MSDYIKREDAMAEFEHNGSATVYGIDKCKAIISRLQLVPSADVVKVVRCKDCKYRIYDDSRNLYYCYMYYGMGDVSDDNYCSKGEHK